MTAMTDDEKELAREAAAAADAEQTAAAPSETRQQSSRRSGSTIQGEASYMSRVSGNLNCACGLLAPCLRQAMAMAACTSLMSPWSCM